MAPRRPELEATFSVRRLGGHSWLYSGTTRAKRRRRTPSRSGGEGVTGRRGAKAEVYAHAAIKWRMMSLLGEEGSFIIESDDDEEEPTHNDDGAGAGQEDVSSSSFCATPRAGGGRNHPNSYNIKWPQSNRESDRSAASQTS